MNDAELHVETLRRFWPTVCGKRERCLDSLFNTSYGFWHAGGIRSRFKVAGLDKMFKMVKKGTAPTVEQRLKEHHLEHARKSYSESDRLSERSVEDIAATYGRMSAESSQVAEQYSLSDATGLPLIHNIPDDIHPEWLALVFEYLTNVLNAKIDFDKNSILNESDRKVFGERERLTEEQVESRNKIAEDILRSMCEDEGKEYIPRTAEQKRKDHEEWERVYSPRARAEQANARNKDSRKVAAKIMKDLRRRKLIPLAGLKSSVQNLSRTI